MTPPALPNLRPFRRQFVVAPHPVRELPAWRHVEFAGLHVHADPDLSLTVSSGDEPRLLLLGFALDPARPEADDAAVLASLDGDAIGSPDWWTRVDRLSGRFVLLVRGRDGLFGLTDASALRRMVYARDPRGLYAASDTALLRRVLPLEDGGRVAQWASSEHFRRSEEHWLPGDVTLYPRVTRLLANHELLFATGEQRRIWPRGRLLVSDDPARTAEAVGDTLRRSIAAAARRFPLSLPLTAGLDSRTLLAACGALATSIDIYTSLYRDVVSSSADAAVPARVLAARGLPHRLVNGRARPSAAWRQAYLRHTTLAHYRDIGMIGFGATRDADPERVVLNGTVAEAARFFFARDGRPPVIRSAGDLLRLVPGWSEVPFVVEAVTSWYERAKHLEEWGYDLSSLFYWEHRTGGWQAQSQLECDLAHESFSPFSNRAMLQSMLGVPDELRLGSRPAFLYDIPLRLAPWALDVPVNPVTRADRVRRFLWRAQRKLLRPLTWRLRRRDLMRAVG